MNAFWLDELARHRLWRIARREAPIQFWRTTPAITYGDLVELVVECRADSFEDRTSALWVIAGPRTGRPPHEAQSSSDSSPVLQSRPNPRQADNAVESTPSPQIESSAGNHQRRDIAPRWTSAGRRQPAAPFWWAATEHTTLGAGRCRADCQPKDRGSSNLSSSQAVPRPRGRGSQPTRFHHDRLAAPDAAAPRLSHR